MIMVEYKMMEVCNLSSRFQQAVMVDSASKTAIFLWIVSCLLSISIPDSGYAAEQFIVFDGSHGQMETADLLHDSDHPARLVNVQKLSGLIQEHGISHFGAWVIDAFGYSLKSWEESSLSFEREPRPTPLHEPPPIISAPPEFFSLE